MEKQGLRPKKVVKKKKKVRPKKPMGPVTPMAPIKPDWAKIFTCNKCGQILSVKETNMHSKKISVKGECVRNRHSYKLELHYEDQADWQDYWVRGVRTCEKCGDFMTQEIEDHSYHRHENKFKMVCRRHGGRRRKIKCSHRYQFEILKNVMYE